MDHLNKLPPFFLAIRSALMNLFPSQLGLLRLVFARQADRAAHKTVGLRIRTHTCQTPRLTLCSYLLFIAAAGGLCPQALSAAPAFIQGNFAVPQTSQTSVTVAYTKAQTAGNLNVVIVGWNDTTNVVSSILDTNGNTYVLAVGPTRRSPVSQSIYYARNIAGGSNSVTVSFGGSTAFPDIRVLEYSGLDASNPFDVAKGTSGSGNIEFLGNNHHQRRLGSVGCS